MVWVGMYSPEAELTGPVELDEEGAYPEKSPQEGLSPHPHDLPVATRKRLGLSALAPCSSSGSSPSPILFLPVLH